MPILSGADPVLQVSFFMIITCQVILGVSRRGCNFLLQMIQYIINLTILRAGSNISQSDQKLLSDIPTDFRRTEEQFHIKPTIAPSSLYALTVIVTQLTCPLLLMTRLGYTQELAPIVNSKAGIFAARSFYGLTGVQGRTVYIPVKRFVKNSFKDWLAGLLARPRF